MMTAAVANRRRVFRILPAGIGEDEACPAPFSETRGITATPVSNPLIPSASLGKMMAEANSNIVQSP